MNTSSKRKLEQGQQSDSDVLVEWVDDNEWNAIQSAFDALSKSSGFVDESRQRRDYSSRAVISSSSTTASLSMLPSILPPTSTTTTALHYRPGHSSASRHIPQEQREYQFRTGFSPNNNGEGANPWNGMGLLPCQFPTRNVGLGGGGRRRTQSANNECPEFFSNDSNISSGERTEERTGTDSRPLEAQQESCLPGGASYHPELAVGSGSSIREESISEVIPPDAEERGSRELSDKQSVRRLPAWMMDPVRQWLLPAKCGSSVVEQIEQSRGVSGLEVVIVSETVVEEEETRRASVELGNLASAPQQMENGHPVWFQSEKPQVVLPWGLQPASFVGELKTKFPTMQFRGQIVYSKTESEVSAATDELWRRVHELQQTAPGATIPIGFDLEWRASFEKGEIPRKVAVLQLCLDGHRCDVMQIIYSGIPLSLQDLLEAPSTLKVGVGIYGDASKLRQDYQIMTRKIADLRVIANQKMRNLKQWSLSSLALELTGKQVEKIKSIRCGDWEALPLSEPQLQYAATDAFASLHLYQVLASFPNPGHESNQGCGDDSKSSPEPPTT